MAKRRLKGEGSYTTLPSGKIRVQFFHSGRRYGVTADTVETARKERDERMKELDAGFNCDRRMTLRRWFEVWQEGRARSLRVGSIGQANNALANIIDEIGHLKIANITERHILPLLRWNGNAESTATSKITLVKAMFNAAVRAGIISRSPLVNTRMKHTVGKRYIPPTILADTRAALEAIRGHRVEPCCVLMWLTGLRIGEALGLQWGDVVYSDDLQKVDVTVQRQWCGHPLHIGEPKTQASYRTVASNGECIKAFELQREYNTVEGHSESEWVFPGRFGDVPKSQNTIRLPLIKLCGYNPHMFRHAHATLLLSRGMQLYYVSRRLGHSKISTTAEIYAHVIPDDNDRLIEVLKDA